MINYQRVICHHPFWVLIMLIYPYLSPMNVPNHTWIPTILSQNSCFNEKTPGKGASYSCDKPASLGTDPTHFLKGTFISNPKKQPRTSWMTPAQRQAASSLIVGLRQPHSLVLEIAQGTCEGPKLKASMILMLNRNMLNFFRPSPDVAPHLQIGHDDDDDHHHHHHIMILITLKFATPLNNILTGVITSTLSS